MMDEFKKILGEISVLSEEHLSLINEISFFYNKGLTGAAYESTLKLAEISEKITLLTRSIVVQTAIGRAHSELSFAKSPMNIKVGFTENRWFVLDIPALLPKKARSKSAEYIKSSVAVAMMQFFMGKPKIVIDECVIVFRHVYSRSRPERQYRDYDNIEVKAIIDLIASFLLTDDGPMRCSYFQCSAESDHDRTEVYVLPMTDFIDWTYAVIFKQFDGFELLDYDRKTSISEV